MRDVHANPEVSSLAGYVVKQIVAGKKELQTEAVLLERVNDNKENLTEETLNSEGEEKKQVCVYTFVYMYIHVFV